MRDSYVIRIYKRQLEQVTGIVEMVSSKKRIEFKNSSELWSVIINEKLGPGDSNNKVLPFPVSKVVVKKESNEKS